MAKKTSGNVSIGKFDILATNIYATGLLDGLDDGEAKERGIVAAIMGAKARLGGAHHDSHKADKDAAEKKKKTTITAESFNKQVAEKMGRVLREILPARHEEAREGRPLLRQGEEAPEHSSTWGAKIGGQQFEERVSNFEAE